MDSVKLHFKSPAKHQRQWSRTVRLFILYISCLMIGSLVVMYSMIPSRREEESFHTERQKLEHKWRLIPSPEVSCKIPSLNPFEKAIVKTMAPKDEDWRINCKRSQVFTADSKWNLFQHSKHDKLECCYRQMKPHPKPKASSYSKVFTYSHVDPTLLSWYSPICTPIKRNVTRIPYTYEFISVECTRLRNSTMVQSRDSSEKTDTSIVYKDMFAFIPHKLPKIPGSRESPPRASVLILGLDQMSLGQFIRHFPDSYQFLQNHLDMKTMFGYNKVGDSTLPNVVSLLTGKSLEELTFSCWNHSFLSFFDDCPLLWKNFTEGGYLTSYAEDKLPYSIFYNSLYARRGFRNQPTDYFYNFVGMEQQKSIRSQSMCVNDRLRFKDMLDYVQKTAESLKSDPYFQFTWSSSLTTKSYNLARNGDVPLLDALRQLVKTNVFNNTILIVMSDHGYRFSPLIELRQGRYESKMPLFMASFPKWFSQKYPEALSNFEQNSYRLTTPFDVHQTLLDLIRPEDTLKAPAISKRAASVPPGARAISLFLPIPLNRSCESAGIESKYCICQDSKPLKYFHNSEIVSKFTTKILDEINVNILGEEGACKKLLINDGYVSKLSVVLPEGYKGLSNINGSTKWERRNSNKEYFLLKENIPGHFPDAVRPRLLELPTNGGNFSEVLVTIQTVPGLGVFEGRLRLERNKWVVQDVLRLNEYSLQSHCVPLYKLKSFCYCKKQIVA